MKSRSMYLLRFTCAACFFCMLATAHCAPSSVHASIEDFKQGIKKQHQVLAVQHRLLDQLQPLLKKKNDTQRPATTRPHRAPAESFAREPRVHMIDDSHTVGGPNRLFYIEDLLSSAEIQLMMKETLLPQVKCKPRSRRLWLYADAKRKFMGSQTMRADDGSKVQKRRGKPVRRSDTAFLMEVTSSKKVMSIIHRIHKLARMPLKYGEELQITKYDSKGYYQFHWDSHVSVARAVTVLVFLNTVKNGGHTIFPGAKWKQGPATRRLVEGVLRGSLPPAGSALWSTSGLPPLGENHQAAQPDMQPFCDHPGLVRISPVAGNAIMWFNHDPDQANIDQGTLHGGCPPGPGEEKYIAQRWMRWHKRNEPNSFYTLIEACVACKAHMDSMNM